MEQADRLIREIPKGLLNWFGFQQDSKALFIGDGIDVLAEMLEEKRLQVTYASCRQTCNAKWRQEHKESFDYIVSIASLELQPHPVQALCVWKSLLKPGGKLLLGMNNRLGIRYFCGDRDPYTERSFDGVEGYRRAYSREEDAFCGRMYSQAELKRMLQEAGWELARFYSVIPGLENPVLLYAEDYLPNEDLANRVFPTYHYPDSVFLEEEGLYGSLVKDGLFHKMANAYLIECSLDGSHSDISYVTSSMDRGREYALITMIHASGVVEKRAAYPEGKKRLEKLMEHGLELAGHGISVVEARMEQDAYVMPYVHGEVAQVYLKKLLLTDKEKFLQKMDCFRDLILQSSEIIEPDPGNGEGAILRKGYLDMVPLNCFYLNGEFVFYDQEFCEENYPANAILTRMVCTFYAGNMQLQKVLPMDRLFERYGLKSRLEHWRKMERDFLQTLRKEKELRSYHEQHRRDHAVVNSNRQRINYPDEEYQRLFVDIFRNADTRRLILFGSGNFSRRFLALYGQDYPVYAVIDNQREKWGQDVDGITIHPPQILRRLQPGEYKVLICIKNYLSVVRQLREMGVTEYSIYDPHRDYPRKRKPTVQEPPDGAKESAPKKYHVGYIAGVFDLCHVGHLDMFKRAKEQCGYLIVGVVTDEGVRKFKGTEPFIPFEERMEMVRACRYVDEAVEIPFQYGGTRDAYRMYHFDCQFFGSDYADNPDWLADKAFLEKHGADMVFFPYTEGTSSTKLKALIERKLL